MEPILSIITVVFNNEKYIGLAIENFLSQNCDSTEMLIIDGESTDGTVEIIKKYAVEHKNIRWISEQDSGQSHAMNKSLKLAKGKYLSFLNVDDYYSENALKDILGIISGKDAPEFIVGNCNVWNPDGTLQYINQPSQLKIWHLLSGYYLPVNPSAYFYKKEIHNRIGAYNEENHHNMDIEFLIEAASVTEMKYYPKIWGNFRLLPNTKTVNDQNSGTIEQRKKELYQRYLQKSTYKVRAKTKCIILQKKMQRAVFKVKKIIVLPFDKVYYKLKIIIRVFLLKVRVNTLFKDKLRK